MPKKKPSSGNATARVWAALRIGLGFVFLWAFLDKLFGLGFATCRDAKTDVVTQMCDRAWASGGSPTSGFLNNATKGPFEDFYRGLAGNAFVDTLFMVGLLLIGLALILGVGVYVATVSGVALLLMMWTAALPPENNPVLDDHIIYSIVLVGVAIANQSQVWGLGKWWRQTSLVKRFPALS